MGKTVYASYVGSALQLGFIIDDIILQTHSLNFTSFWQMNDYIANICHILL